MRAVWKVGGLILLLQVRTFWRCSDGLFFKVPPLVSNALLTILHPLLKNVNGTIRWVHELFKRPSQLLHHPKRGSFKTTATQTLMTEGWRSLHYYVTPTTTTWHNSHHLSLHNSSILPPVHELFKQPAYKTNWIRIMWHKTSESCSHMIQHANSPVLHKTISPALCQTSVSFLLVLTHKLYC
jgi:hypothetical protein